MDSGINSILALKDIVHGIDFLLMIEIVGIQITNSTEGRGINVLEIVL